MSNFGKIVISKGIGIPLQTLLALGSTQVDQPQDVKNSDGKKEDKYVPSKDKIKLEGYGLSGQETANKVASAIEDYNKSHPKNELTLTVKSGEFTVGNSKELSNEKLKALLAKYEYDTCYPIVQDKRDKNGNLVITLNSFPIDSSVILESSSDKETALEVPQGCAMIAKFDKGKQTDIQTFGLGPCIAVCMYDSETKTGVLAHIDKPTKVTGLSVVVEALKKKGIKFQGLKVTVLVNPDEAGPNLKMFRAIKAFFNKEEILIKEVAINSFDIGSMSILDPESAGGDGSGKAVNLNLETGRITEYKEKISYQNDPKNLARSLDEGIKSVFSDKLVIEDKTQSGSKHKK